MGRISHKSELKNATNRKGVKPCADNEADGEQTGNASAGGEAIS